MEYKGFISDGGYGECDDGIIYISGYDAPIADVFKDDFARKTVTVRYWITDKECTKEGAGMQFLKTLYGCADIDFVSTYSEYTGYLWTDQDINIGGHDLLDELRSHIGSYVILEIDIHESPTQQSIKE